MIFLHLRECFLGFFDNLKSDSYFRGVKISDISVTRMKRWSDRNFSLASLDSITKIQVKALSYSRLKQTMNDSEKWKQVANKLSKSQLLQGFYDSHSFQLYSVNKVKRLFIEGKFRDKNVYGQLLSAFKDMPSEAAKIRQVGSEYGYLSDEMTPQEFFSLIKDLPHGKLFQLLANAKPQHISTETATSILSKMEWRTLNYLWTINPLVMRKVFDCGSSELDKERLSEIRLLIKNAIDSHGLTVIQYIPLNDRFIDQALIEAIKRRIHDYDYSSRCSVFRLALDPLGSSELNFLWNHFPYKMAEYITPSIFLHLAKSNAPDLISYLGDRYYAFLNASSPEDFLAIWNNCPHLHADIIKNCHFNPDLVLHNIDPKNLYLLAGRYPELLRKYPENFFDEHLFDFIDTYKGALHELPLTCDQILHYLKNSPNQAGKENLFHCFYNKYKSKLIEFDSSLIYVKRLYEHSLNELIEIDGIRERLASNWDGENPAHVYLGARFNFCPKDFPSSKWFLYCDKMSPKAFDVWIKTGPKLKYNEYLHAFIRLKDSDIKIFISRGRALWDLAPSELVKHTDSQIRRLFPFVFPLKNWTEEIYNRFDDEYFINLSLSLEYKLDHASAIIDASRVCKMNVLNFLKKLSIFEIPRTSLFETCLIEWNDWLIRDLEKIILDPNESEKEIKEQIKFLIKRKLISSQAEAKIKILFEEINLKKQKNILENAPFKKLKKDLSLKVKELEETKDEVKAVALLDSLSSTYNEIKKLLKGTTIADDELDSQLKIIKKKKVEIDSEEIIFTYFASMLIPNPAAGITPEVIKANQAILQKADARECAVMGDLDDRKWRGEPIIVRDEIGNVDLQESLKRIELAFS